MLSGTPVVPGTTCPTEADAQEKIGWGHRYVSMGNALTIGAQLVKESLESMREGAS